MISFDVLQFRCWSLSLIVGNIDDGLEADGMHR